MKIKLLTNSNCNKDVSLSNPTCISYDMQVDPITNAQDKVVTQQGLKPLKRTNIYHTFTIVWPQKVHLAIE